MKLTDDQEQLLVDLLCKIVKTERGMNFILTLTNSPTVQELIEKLMDGSN